MYNNLENLLEMIETKHEIDMLIENAIDNMSTRELEMLTEAGAVDLGRRGLAYLKGTKTGGKIAKRVEDGVASVRGLAARGRARGSELSTQAIDRVTKAAKVTPEQVAQYGGIEQARKAVMLKNIKSAAIKGGKVAGAGAGVGAVGAAGYGAGNYTGTKKGKIQGHKQGLKTGSAIGYKAGVSAGSAAGAEKARREILAQIKAETDAKRKASLVNKAKNLFGMGE